MRHRFKIFYEEEKTPPSSVMIAEYWNEMNP